MTDDVLRLDAVTFRRNGREILHGVDLTVRAGEHWALLGPNGAGKTTIVGFCAAQTHPTTGTVDVLGRRLGRVDMQELRRHIGHVNPRHPLRSPLSVLEVVLTGFTGTIDMAMRWEPSVGQIARARQVIAEVGLADRAEYLWPDMSQGERGRTLVARALAPEPDLLLLDEPTTGLDVAAREQLLETIDSLARTSPEVASILVTHHLEELPETTSHAMVIAHGDVVASGLVHDVVTTDVITEAFEHPISVGHDGGRWSARAIRTESRHDFGTLDRR
ncbi:ATP-binding cassette domain-containing protein [Gordonia sp. HY442]|uniref:ABC transporter ATP-binding protein n=1 Tax=Gordonia zhenghanii TaxID=2911516 RepID=UPI001EFF9B56|nr:ATP-binding cassette domain-containing protein [Gordonia zhenghanii]MCF8604158.1 ATP-binding cassette domain-containing protein [Gordonia zhenghanii]